MKTIQIIIAVLFLPAIGFSATLNVPVPYPTIQSAINAAGTNDIIQVQPGTYVENIDFLGKKITVTGVGGYGQTFIDGGMNGQNVVTFQGAEDNTTILEGFTIFNGATTTIDGGGIRCGGDSCPIIRLNHITQNSTDWYGGGIWCSGKSSPHIIENIIDHNFTKGYGGGIYTSGQLSGKTYAQIISNIIDHNHADIGGGGMALDGFSEPLVDSNIIKNNRTDDPVYPGWSMGGGIYIHEAFPVITRNLIHDNFASYKGGGVCSYYAIELTFENNTVAYNTADYGEGGGICIDGHSSYNDIELIHNTVVYNEVILGGYGGGLYFDAQYTNLTIMNSIFWGNTTNYPTNGGWDIYVYYANTFMMDYSNVREGNPYVEIPIGGWGDNMTESHDPLFVDHLNRDFHLTQRSPSINRGTNDLTTVDDIDGDLRPEMGTVDIGSDEYIGTHTFAVNVTAPNIIQVPVTGGQVNFTLTAGAANAGSTYLICGSNTGTNPGIQIPSSGAYMPLRYDWFTDVVLLNLNTPMFFNFLNTLDVNGNGTATFTVPNVSSSLLFPSWLHFAYVLVNTTSFVSNPINVRIE